MLLNSSVRCYNMLVSTVYYLYLISYLFAALVLVKAIQVYKHLFLKLLFSYFIFFILRNQILGLRYEDSINQIILFIELICLFSSSLLAMKKLSPSFLSFKEKLQHQ